MTLRRKKKQGRRGLATVEAALCLPIIVLLMLGTIDACTMIFLKQSLTIAAYEGGRTALIPGAKASHIKADCQQIIDDRSISGAKIKVRPKKPHEAAAGEQISIEVSAPCADNSIMPSLFFQGRELTATAYVMNEYGPEPPPNSDDDDDDDEDDD